MKFKVTESQFLKDLRARDWPKAALPGHCPSGRRTRNKARRWHVTKDTPRGGLRGTWRVTKARLG